MQLNQSIYDPLKWVVQVVLPAFGGFYFGLSDYWDLPKALEVVGTTSLLAVFLGSILGISSIQYKKTNEPHAGVLTKTGVDEDTGIPGFGLTVTKDPAELLQKDTVTFRVDSPPKH